VRLGDRRPPTLEAVTSRFWFFVKKSHGCWAWTRCRFPTGYGQFYFYRRKMGAHNVAWILTHGSIPTGLCVLHKCDNRICVRPDHLFLGTKGDNMQDCLAKGRHRYETRRGEDCNKAKLTADQVRAIRLLYPAISQRELGRQYGVSKVAIAHIIHRRNWAHV
jgi:hypothetical protein